jgi:energy-coupling factor transporter ATP-binding protein EcfA2
MPVRPPAPPHPFSPRGEYVLTAVRLEALSRLLFVVEQRRDVAVLIGPTGVGKSRLLDELARQTRQDGRRVVWLDAAGLRQSDLPGAWLSACRLPPTGRPSWSELEDLLVGWGLSGGGGLWIVDHFDQAEDNLAPAIGRLLKGLGRRTVAGTLVLATESPAPLALLGERAEWRIKLQPWTVEETAEAIELLQGRLAETDPRFTPTAVATLHELSAGNPALTLHYGELSLLAASLHGLSQIDGDLVRDATQPLDPAPRDLTGEDLWDEALVSFLRD